MLETVSTSYPDRATVALLSNLRTPEPAMCRACGSDEILVADKGLSFEDNVGAHDDAAWSRLLDCRKVSVRPHRDSGRST